MISWTAQELIFAFDAILSHLIDSLDEWTNITMTDEQKYTHTEK